MRGKSQVADYRRRMPRQARALATVEVIFEATARIIEREGRAALTTNAIAERAGISIGTLYQYFPDKDAILVAMARRELENDRAAVFGAITTALDDPDAPLARIAIRKLIDVHRQRRQVRTVIMQAHLAHGHGQEHVKPVQEIAQMLGRRSDRFLPGRTGPISPASLFVMTRAVSGVVRAALHERSPLLDTAALEDELVRLVQAYLAELRR